MSAVAPRLARASVADLRLLAPSALALWKSLVRHRRAADLPDHEWFGADLRTMAARARIRSYATARRALRILRDAGLVATIRCRASRWARDRRTGVLGTVSAQERNLYLVVGDYTRRSGVDHVSFPARAWGQFVARRRAGDPAPVDAWCEPSYDHISTPKDLGMEQGFRSSGDKLRPRSYTSVFNSVSISEKEETSKKAADAAFSTTSADTTLDDLVAASGMEDDEVDILPPIKGSICFAGQAPPPPPRVGKCPWLPPDSVPPPPPAVLYLSPEMGAEQLALAVVDGYRRAVQAVYGIDWWHYRKGDLKKAKGYAALVAAGRAMAEHSVPAEHWAIWRLRWMRSHNPRFATAAPPILAVMSGVQIGKRAGWFRKEYDVPVSTYKGDPVIAEQFLRNQEAYNRWNGATGDAAFYVLPIWYVEKRRAEIRDGAINPHDLWPTKPGSRYGRVRS